MLERLQIQGFRCFGDLDIDGFAPVTIITGKNGTGKTALLEATLIAHNPRDPSPLLHMQAQRGYQFLNTQTGPSYRGVFRDFASSGEASITGSFRPLTGPVFEHRCRIRRSDESFTFQVGMSTSTAGLETTNDLELDQLDPLGNVIASSKLTWMPAADGEAPGRLRAEKTAQAPIPAILCHPPGNTGHDPWEQRIFGDVRSNAEGGSIEPMIAGLQAFEPRLRDLEFTRDSFGDYFVAVLDDRRRIPLNLMGGGINSAFRYLVNLSACHGGTLIVDEIENGIHYSVQEDFAQILMVAAAQNQTQLVVSTHSSDMLRAIGEALAKSNSDGVLIHLAKDAAGAYVKTIEGQEVTRGMRLGYELR